jgi:hypothetical protein
MPTICIYNIVKSAITKYFNREKIWGYVQLINFYNIMDPKSTNSILKYMHKIVKSNKRCHHSGLNGMTDWLTDKGPECKDSHVPQFYVVPIYPVLF